jgi:hypothetical protein
LAHSRLAGTRRAEQRVACRHVNASSSAACNSAAMWITTTSHKLHLGTLASRARWCNQHCCRREGQHSTGSGGGGAVAQQQQRAFDASWAVADTVAMVTTRTGWQSWAVADTVAMVTDRTGWQSWAVADTVAMVTDRTGWQSWAVADTVAMVTDRTGWQCCCRRVFGRRAIVGDSRCADWLALDQRLGRVSERHMLALSGVPALNARHTTSTHITLALSARLHATASKHTCTLLSITMHVRHAVVHH